MTCKLIGIAGPAGVGKSTAGKMLAEMLQPAIVRPLAEPLKEGCQAMLGFTPADKDSVLPNQVVTYRQVLVAVGQAIRAIDDNFWVRSLAASVASFPGYATVIVDDVRMENEASWIRANGGTMIHLRRPGVEYAGGVTEQALGEHPDDITITTETQEQLEGLLWYYFKDRGEM